MVTAESYKCPKSSKSTNTFNFYILDKYVLVMLTFFESFLCSRYFCTCNLICFFFQHCYTDEKNVAAHTYQSQDLNLGILVVGSKFLITTCTALTYIQVQYSKDS